MLYWFRGRESSVGKTDTSRIGVSRRAISPSHVNWGNFRAYIESPTSDARNIPGFEAASRALLDGASGPTVAMAPSIMWAAADFRTEKWDVEQMAIAQSNAAPS